MPNQRSSSAAPTLHKAPADRVPGRSTRAIIDLDAVAENVSILRNGVSPNTQLMAVVKANGYGHGAVMVARTALDAGATYLGVATVDEGIQLRAHGIEAQILVLGPIDVTEIGPAVDASLSLTIASEEFARAVARCVSSKNNGPASVHLKIDTGMRRFGVLPDEAVNLANVVCGFPSLRFDGTFSHFASADEESEATTSQQFHAFLDALSDLQEARIDPGIRHISNSAATLRDRRLDLDMVRVGIALYGLPPSADVRLWPGMRPAMTIKSKVTRVIRLNAGDRVSYGGIYQADKNEIAALVPIGYADGYTRNLSNAADMSVNGHVSPVRGRVCMDQTMVGIPEGASVKPGDIVTVAGDGTDGAPTLTDLARLSGTINYEMATSVARRVLRIYVCSGSVIAIEDLQGLREF